MPRSWHDLLQTCTLQCYIQIINNMPIIFWTAVGICVTRICCFDFAGVHDFALRLLCTATFELPPSCFANIVMVINALHPCRCTQLCCSLMSALWPWTCLTEAT